MNPDLTFTLKREYSEMVKEQQPKYRAWRPTWNAHCDWCNAATEILYDVPDNATGECDCVCAKCAGVEDKSRESEVQ